LTARGILGGLALCVAVANLAMDNPAALSTSSSAETQPTAIMNQEITNLLRAYETALNTSDANAAVALHGSEPIIMPQNAPAFIGREAVQATYNHFFEILKLNVAFTIQEIVDIGGSLAYGRTTSAGTQEILDGHKVSKEANNELFIFRKEAGHWKIHRYLFASSNPPAAD
ncbi:MAG TPA: nuclear transport factor 2 family protein, partial [Chthoniobacterales bacterium]